MGFRFNLETVLRLRQSLEDAERLRLQTMLVDRAQLHTRIGETNASRAALGAKLNISLQEAALCGGEMQFVLQRLRACDMQFTRLSASALALGQQIERQQALLLRRRIDRRVLEQLRERQKVRYEADTQRHEQSKLEELFLLRRQRGTISD